MSGFISFLSLILPFMLKVYNEYLSTKAKNEAANQKFNLDQAAFNEIVQNAINKMQADLPKQTQGAGNAWDAADQDKK